MNTGAKILLLLGVTGVAGIGIYLYLKNKNAVQTSPSVPSTPPAAGLIASQPPTNQYTQPTTKEVASAATDFIQQTAQQTQQAAQYAYKDSPVPLPSDLSVLEIQSLTNYCKLPDGKLLNVAYHAGGGSGLFSNTSSSINYDINTKWGLANTLRDRAGQQQSYDDYFNKLKTYRGC